MVAQTEDNHSQPYLLNEHLCLSVVELKTNIKIYVYLCEVGLCAWILLTIQVSMSLYMIMNLNLSGV